MSFLTVPPKAFVVSALISGLTDRERSIGAFRDAAATPPSNPISVGAVDRLSALLKRDDPQMPFSWIGLVMDRDNPQCLNWEYIDAIQTPGLHFEDNPIFREGKLKHYIGTFSVDNLTLTIYTDVRGTAQKFVSSWFNAARNNQNGNLRLPSEYKKDVYVYLLDQTNGTVCLIKFIGCAPASWASYNLDGQSSTPLATTLELTVDDISFEADDGGTNINNQLDALAASENSTSTPQMPFSQTRTQIQKFTDRIGGLV